MLYRLYKPLLWRGLKVHMLSGLSPVDVLVSPGSLDPLLQNCDVAAEIGLGPGSFVKFWNECFILLLKAFLRPFKLGV